MFLEQHDGAYGRLRIERWDDWTILKCLYVATTFLCTFMVMWILVFPSSWLMGHSDLHDRLVDKYLVDTYDGVHVPPTIVTKYTGHPAIQFSHILPGALWAAAIPFQLHPDIRKKHRAAHRRIGYAFFACSIMQAIGIFLILMRNLTFDRDYAELPPFEGMERWLGDAGIICQTLWFLLTAATAVSKARSGDIRTHRKFVLRHVASGLWIAPQRMIVVAYKAETSMQMREMFSRAGFIAIVLCFLLGEWAIYLLERTHKHSLKRDLK
mmetsp:Transcript_20677/g.38809  ORF Transcript_20677/g.38809 Transcript_20677/m.38809 type:complete len:267 (-) Transcript_20677:687-1487(-)